MFCKLPESVNLSLNEPFKVKLVNKGQQGYCSSILFGWNANNRCKNANPPLLQNAWQQIIMQLFMIMITPNTSMIIWDARQDNGATCLNCKVDFSLEMLTAASPSVPPPLPHPHAPFTFEMQAVWVSHSARPPISHSHYLSSLLALSISLPSLTTLSFTVPWYDQRQLCDTVWGIQEAENIKPLKSNLQKDRHRGPEARVQVCVRVCVCLCDKQMNKLTRQERGMTLPSAHRWKVGRCPSEVRFCTDLKEEGRACIRAAV